MKKSKKLLSVLLALAMIFTSVSVGLVASAASDAEQAFAAAAAECYGLSQASIATNKIAEAEAKLKNAEALYNALSESEKNTSPNPDYYNLMVKGLELAILSARARDFLDENYAYFIIDADANMKKDDGVGLVALAVNMIEKFQGKMQQIDDKAGNMLPTAKGLLNSVKEKLAAVEKKAATDEECQALKEAMGQTVAPAGNAYNYKAWVDGVKAYGQFMATRSYTKDQDIKYGIYTGTRYSNDQLIEEPGKGFCTTRNNMYWGFIEGMQFVYATDAQITAVKDAYAAVKDMDLTDFSAENLKKANAAIAAYDALNMSVIEMNYKDAVDSAVVAKMAEMKDFVLQDKINTVSAGLIDAAKTLTKDNLATVEAAVTAYKQLLINEGAAVAEKFSAEAKTALKACQDFIANPDGEQPGPGPGPGPEPEPVDPSNPNVVIKDFKIELPRDYTMDKINEMVPAANAMIGSLLTQFVGTTIYTETVLNAILGVLMPAVFGRDGLLPSDVGSMIDALPEGNPLEAYKDADWDDVKYADLKWGFEDGDSDAFVNNISGLFNGLLALVGGFLVDDPNGEVNVDIDFSDLGSLMSLKSAYRGLIYPVLTALELDNVKTPEQYTKEFNEDGDINSLLNNILLPVFDLVDDMLKNPINVLAEKLPVIANAIYSGKLDVIFGLVAPGMKGASFDLAGTVNGLLASNNIAIKLPSINLTKLIDQSPANTFVLVLDYLYNFITDDATLATISDLVGGMDAGTADIINGVLGSFKGLQRYEFYDLICSLIGVEAPEHKGVIDGIDDIPQTGDVAISAFAMMTVAAAAAFVFSKKKKEA